MADITPESLVVMGPRPRGRPLRAGMRSSCRVEIVMTPQERDALKQMAAEQRQPMASVIRDAVNEFVADYTERRVFRSRASGPFE